MTANPGKDTESWTIAFDDLKMLLASIFEKNGTSATVAHILCRHGRPCRPRRRP